MLYMKALEFDEIAKSIIYTDKYQSLKDEPHHGLNRYIHCLNVAKMTYNLARLFKLDYISATRGALLHDYFNDCDYKEIRGIKKNSMHPIIALNNARCEFELNDKEENIIASHMFPFGDIKPNCRESWLVTTADKLVAIRECSAYKVKEQVALWTIFLINIINVNM